MPNLTSEFFGELAERAHDPWLQSCEGSLRFDLDNGGSEHWLVTIADGAITVRQDGVDADTPADAVFHADRAVFERLVRGEINPLSTILRGGAHVEGDPNLVVRFRRVFPGPATRPANEEAAMA